MVDYSLPVSKRTRLRRAMAGMEDLEQRRKRRKKNRADSASDNVRGRASSGKRVNVFEHSSVNRTMEVDPVRFYDDSDGDSLEEIDALTFGREGGDSVTFVDSESSGGLKNVKERSKKGFLKGNIDIIDLEDEVILSDDDDDEGFGFDSVNSMCSISKSATAAAPKDGGFVCFDSDNEENSSGLLSSGKGKDALEISPDKSMGESDCLNSNGCSYETEPTCCSDDAVDESTELRASSSEEEFDDSSDRNYELEESHQSSSESSSSEDGKSNRNYCAEVGNRRERKERRKRVNLIEGGLRRKAYGLDIFVDFKEDEHNKNVKVGAKVSCIARRTRSCFGFRARKINTDLGTVSQPVCVDEEGLDFQCDKKEIGSSSRHDSGDSCDSDSTTDDEVYKPWAWSSSKKKTQFNNQSDDGFLSEKKDDDTNKVESFRVGSRLWNSKSSPKTDKHNRNEDFQKVHPKNGHEFHDIIKTKGRSVPKGIDVFNILVDSIIADKELPSDELDLSTSQVSHMPLPLKFGLVESRLPEKSEEEKELDKLWAELDFAIRSSEIGLVDSNTVEHEDAFPSKPEQVDLCLRGDHQLILDEQIGLRCRCCSHVKLEIRDIVPSFDTNPHGKSQKRESGSFERVKYDNLQQDFDCDPHDGSDSRSHFGRTVWDIIPGIRNSMYPHQREGFEFIWKNIAGGIYLDELREKGSLNNGSGCIVSHAPGTGKTRLTINFLQTYMELNPTCRPMIIAPSSMLLTWEEEFLKWNVGIPFHNLNKRDFSFHENISALKFLMQASPSGQDVETIRLVKVFSWKKEKSILGVSYRLFERLAGVRNNSKCAKVRNVLLELPDLVVFDEGHIPRNDDSLIWMALSKIKTERRIILSGTPFQNNFTEFYNTLRLVRPKFADENNSGVDDCMDKKRGRPKNISRGKWDLLISSIGRTSELESAELKEIRALINPFVHVYRGSILQEKLPGLRKSTVILWPAELQKSFLERVQARKHSFEVEYVESLISVHPSLILKCDKGDCEVDKDMLERSRLNPELGVKLQFLLEIIRLSEALNEKVLVFSQYIEPLSFIEEHLKFHFKWTEGIELFHMDGKREIKKRQALINTFNDPTSEVRVLLASTKACSEGINLVGASRVVLLDVVWNPSVERQAICRAYRLGQKKVVYVYHLITSGTREEEKYSRQVEKDRLSQLVFSSEQNSNEVKVSSTDLDDRILEAVLQHEKFKKMFQKIVYQSKESCINENFGLADKE
ncbi:SNF2 domain-containing protein CLASSY 3-like [Benincasa hispida]|uniref:SNF2 domain-containing protein CLASSY 3-like n=1 Tax=Benincasa hispida TaxID=102211 RepID=UPI0019002E7E|nr:SNF2 domain-containing protein CLASSY 3-like [Benincasa hispida]XP_038888950.1 SNF2 domain-containing protein CLASSY 3-like [Benincasa hispida]